MPLTPDGQMAMIRGMIRRLLARFARPRCACEETLRGLDVASKSNIPPDASSPSATPSEGTPATMIIRINRTDYTIPYADRVTGEYLRNVPDPPVSHIFDLWRVVPGRDDLKVADTDSFPLTGGMRFYTVPSVITAGTVS